MKKKMIKKINLDLVVDMLNHGKKNGALKNLHKL